MLSQEYPAGVAVISCDASGTGALLAIGERAARGGTALFQPKRLPLLCAQRVRPDGGMSAAVLPSQDWQHTPTSKFATMTRLAAVNGGRTGSHPAREPV